MKAPPHEPRHPLQDWLYYPLHEYRTAKRLGLRAGQYRRRCLDLIAQIKGRKCGLFRKASATPALDRDNATDPWSEVMDCQQWSAK